MSNFQDRSLKAQLRRSPGKTATLGALGVLLLVIWLPRMFGGSGDASSPASHRGNPNATRGGNTAQAEIRSFDQAVERIRTWREVLQLDQEIPVFLPNDDGEPFIDEREDDFSVTSLTLTGTAVLGRTKYALFEDTKVQEGQSIGRYTVQQIHPREVVLVNDETGQQLILKLADSDLR